MLFKVVQGGSALAPGMSIVQVSTFYLPVRLPRHTITRSIPFPAPYHSQHPCGIQLTCAFVCAHPRAARCCDLGRTKSRVRSPRAGHRVDSTGRDPEKAPRMRVQTVRRVLSPFTRPAPTTPPTPSRTTLRMLLPQKWGKLKHFSQVAAAAAAKFRFAAQNEKHTHAD